MRIKHLISSIFILLSILSCNGNIKYKNQQHILFTFLEANHIIQQPHSYVLIVIPVDGCHKCISDAASFGYKRIKSDNLYIVFSSLELKNIIFKLPKVSHNKHILIDSTGYFLKTNFVSYYPIAAIVEDGQIKNIIDLSDEQKTIKYSYIDSLLK